MLSARSPIGNSWGRIRNKSWHRRISWRVYEYGRLQKDIFHIWGCAFEPSLRGVLSAIFLDGVR